MSGIIVGDIFTISDLPTISAVYALYGGRKRNSYVAYVGLARNLKRRIIQHLLKQDSSVSTGTSAVTLNPDYVTEIVWWEHPKFEKSHFLHASELVAFDILDPALRSRGSISEKAKNLYDEQEFKLEIESLFSNKPNGRLKLLTLQEALEKICKLEKRIKKIELFISKNKIDGI